MLRYFGQFFMRVVHPNNLFSSDLMLKKACVLYMPELYTQRFTVLQVRKGEQEMNPAVDLTVNVF